MPALNRALSQLGAACVLASLLGSSGNGQVQYSSVPGGAAADYGTQSQQANSALSQPNVAQAQIVGVPLAQVASVPNTQNLTPPSAQPGTPAPPFQLDAVEQNFVDQILQMWENESSKIKTFTCKFQRLEYDPVFGPANVPAIKSTGVLTYAKPDKGSFKIEEIFRYTQKEADKPATYELQKEEVGEHWVCDGQAIFEYKHDKKQLVVQPLPKEMQGKSIVDGPLPFLFGAEATKLKARYWIRSKRSDPSQIWLEAYPRNQNDAANYHHVDVMLDRKTMMPSAIQVHMPNGNSSAVYTFENPTVNGALNQLFGALFNQPRTPLGWTRVVEQFVPDAQAAQQSETQLK